MIITAHFACVFNSRKFFFFRQNNGLKKTGDICLRFSMYKDVRSGNQML